jgi:hypothetical protein
MYHLQRTGAMCHECHYNVHSNVQAQNTIFGDGTGCIGGTPQCPAGLPPDAEDGITDGISDTHLINFAPPGPTIYSGERKCDDARVSSTDDMPCTTAGFTPTQLANPNPQFTSSPASGQQQNADAAKANVFEGVEGVTADRPVWYYTETDFSDDGTPATYGVFRCNLRCHGVVMSTCFYMGNANENLIRNMNTNGTASSDTWCAGGRSQIAPDTLGAAPPEIKKLLAEFGRDLASGRLATGAVTGLQAAANAHRHPDP